MRPTRLATLAIALAGTLWASVATTASAQEIKVRFTLDWRFDGGTAALALLTRGKGYFAREGLDVAIDSGSGSASAIQRISAGTHDMGFADSAALIEFVSANPAVGLQAVYVVMESGPASVFALKKSGIKTPADLQGKSLAAPVFDAGRKAWPLFAKANGLDPAKVTWKNVDPALRETLLERGDTDAITGFYYTSLLNLRARGVKDDDMVVFRYADHGVNLYGNVLVVTTKLTSEQPKAVAGFVRALNQGIKDVLANPEAAIAFVRERDPLIDVNVETQRLKLFLDYFIATPGAKKDGLGTLDRARLKSNVDQIVAAYGLKNPVDADKLFSDAFLPPAAERKF